MATQIATTAYDFDGAHIHIASNGDIYVLVMESTDLDMWRSQNGGTSFTLLDTYTSGYTNVCVDSAMNGNDDIYVVFNSGTGPPDVMMFDSSAGTFGIPWDVIPSFTESGNGQTARVAVDCDTNGYPCVLYTNYVKDKGTTYQQVYYRYWTGTAWSTPELVDTVASINYGARMNISIGGSASSNPIIWVRFIDITNGDWKYRVKSLGVWDTIGTYSGYSTAFSIFQEKGVLITSAPSYRQYQRKSSLLYENNTSTAMSINSSIPISATLIDGSQWVVAVDETNSDEINLYTYDTGWTEESTVVDAGNSIVWTCMPFSVNFDNNPTDEVPFIYIVDTGTNQYLYYEAFSLSSAVEITPSPASCVAKTQAPSVVCAVYITPSPVTVPVFVLVRCIYGWGLDTFSPTVIDNFERADGELGPPWTTVLKGITGV